jgi:hypothetical protein
MWASVCSTATRSRSLARPAGVVWRWRSSVSNCSSGWIVTLRPWALAVQRCRSVQAAQVSAGKCTTPPGDPSSRRSGSESPVLASPAGTPSWRSDPHCAPARLCKRSTEFPAARGPVDSTGRLGRCSSRTARPDDPDPLGCCRSPGLRLVGRGEADGDNQVTVRSLNTWRLKLSTRTERLLRLWRIWLSSMLMPIWLPVRRVASPEAASSTS